MFCFVERISIDLDLAPTLISDLPKETFPPLQIEYPSFIKSIEEKITNNSYQLHYLDLIQEFIQELIKHSSTLWFVDSKDFHRNSIGIVSGQQKCE